MELLLLLLLLENVRTWYGVDEAAERLQTKQHNDRAHDAFVRDRRSCRELEIRSSEGFRDWPSAAVEAQASNATIDRLIS